MHRCVKFKISLEKSSVAIKRNMKKKTPTNMPGKVESIMSPGKKLYAHERHIDICVKNVKAL